MNITNNKNLSFTAEPIYSRVRINEISPNGKQKPRGARIVSLNPNNSEDYAAFQNIVHEWQNGYSLVIAGDFLRAKYDKSFLAIEVPTRPSVLSDRIKAVASISTDGNITNIDHLQASPDSEFGTDERRFKGSGSVLIGGVVRHAQALGADEITLESDIPQSTKFYSKINFPQDIQADDPKMYRLSGKGIDNFVNSIEQKYNFKYI